LGVLRLRPQFAILRRNELFKMLDGVDMVQHVAALHHLFWPRVRSGSVRDVTACPRRRQLSPKAAMATRFERRHNIGNPRCWLVPMRTCTR
jgi:hypothetical protein